MGYSVARGKLIHEKNWSGKSRVRHPLYVTAADRTIFNSNTYISTPLAKILILHDMKFYIQICFIF